MKLVWKYGRLSSISFLKSSIPFWHRPYSIPCPGCRFYIIIIIVTFYPNGCSQVENPEAPDFKKIASASGSFSTLSLPSSLPLPTSFIKVLPLPLPRKINRFHRFRFQLPLPLPHPCLSRRDAFRPCSRNLTCSKGFVLAQVSSLIYAHLVYGLSTLGLGIS